MRRFVDMAEEALGLLRDMHKWARESREDIGETCNDIAAVRRLLEQEAAYSDKRLVRVAGHLQRVPGVGQ